MEIQQHLMILAQNIMSGKVVACKQATHVGLVWLCNDSRFLSFPEQDNVAALLLVIEFYKANLAWLELDRM